ncbi:MAG: GerMN domain-containing protein, partial [Mycobacteriales bacterium]
MTRNRPALRLAAGGALVLLAAGCGASSSPSRAADLTPAATPSTPSTVSTSPSASSAQTEARAVYYLGDDGGDPRLYREFHRRTAQSTPTAQVKDAVEAMLTAPAQDSDYTSLWSRQTIVRGVRITDTTAYVDLSSQARTANAGAAAENASVQQLVHTVTAAANDVRTVQLLIDGK